MQQRFAIKMKIWKLLNGNEDFRHKKGVDERRERRRKNEWALGECNQNRDRKTETGRGNRRMHA